MKARSARSSSIPGLPLPAPCTDLSNHPQLGRLRTAAWFVALAVVLIAAHAPLLHLPYFWDEAGYYIPAARDLLAGSLIPHSTPSNAHPPLVMAWLALNWKLFGQSQTITRCAMLMLAAFSLLGFFRLARSVANTKVAAPSTFLVAVYPVFFSQSSLAQVDLPAAGLTFWGLEAYVRRRPGAMIAWFSLAALAKETAILIPIALFVWEVIVALRSRSSRASVEQAPGWLTSRGRGLLLIPLLPLILWYVYHDAHTGFVFGNPEFFRYNVQETLHPLRILLALLLRTWQVIGYLNLYILTLACLLAMTYPALPDERGAQRPRIDFSIQLAFLAVAIVYLLAMSVVGGAALARYMLPVVPLVILVCVSTVWRRLKAWPAVLALVAAAFIVSIFVNPPYGFSPEDNLAYRDYIDLHQRAEAYIETHDPGARVLTAWPASDELSRPYLGFVAKPLQVVRIEDFTVEQMLSVADLRSRFDVALVFSTKIQPRFSFFDRWQRWREWKARYFGYHVDLDPQEAATALGGRLVFIDRRPGQWVGVIELERIQEADARIPARNKR